MTDRKATLSVGEAWSRKAYSPTIRDSFPRPPANQPSPTSTAQTAFSFTAATLLTSWPTTPTTSKSVICC